MDISAVKTAKNGERKAPKAQNLVYPDLPDPIYEKMPDPGRFAEILRAMKGMQSVHEFANSTGLSDSFLSKAINSVSDKIPSKRTLLKLLRAETETTVSRMELAEAAGYPADKIDWERVLGEEDESQRVSAAEAIVRIYGGNHYLACGRLMKSLSEHGVDGDMSSFVHREDGYFEITDETTGQVYVGINVYCNADHDRDNTVFSMMFSLALTHQKICLTSGDVGEKVVIIMTNDEQIFEGCRNCNFNGAPKATMIVLTDDFKGIKREEVLKGSSPISLVD